MSTFDYGKIHITTSKKDLDMEVIMNFMNSHSYWARERDRKTMQKAVDTSLCFGMYYESEMIGFARIITDFATMYYLCDVFIRPEYQKKGLGKKLVKAVLDAPELQGLYGILLTKDAHELYKRFGFSGDPESAGKFMIRRDWNY